MAPVDPAKNAIYGWMKPADGVMTTKPATTPEHAPEKLRRKVVLYNSNDTTLTSSTRGRGRQRQQHKQSLNLRWVTCELVRSTVVVVVVLLLFLLVAVVVKAVALNKRHRHTTEACKNH